MHQDIGMARQVNQELSIFLKETQLIIEQAKLACLNLLNNTNTESKLVIVTLRTLTLLLSEAVIDRKEQV